jgi:HPr kinase/phosphorylase
MHPELTVREFHQRFQKHLKLSFLSGQVGLDRPLRMTGDDEEHTILADYLNIIRPTAIVIIGRRESSHLAAMDGESRKELLKRLLDQKVCTVILSRLASLSASDIKLFNKASIAVFRSELKDPDLLSNLRYFIDQSVSEKVTLHGVFIDVFSVGIFVTGESGVGKSELGLTLVSRGHRLIADDITEFSRFGPSVIDGAHPGISNEFMEVRGLGILNVRAMFGSNALRRNKSLAMIFNMVHFTEQNRHKFDRLGTERRTRNVLGVEIPELTLPVAPGRNMAVLVEAAARNHILNKNGYNAAEDFIEQQRRAIHSNSQG